MRLLLQRFFQTSDSTIGGLFLPDRKFECLTLEDIHRDTKVYGQTRIPAGIYKIKLQVLGSMSPKYALKFPTMHKGMLWLQDVPNFTTIYMHIGNKDEDTLGCILIGKNYIDGQIQGSTDAYKVFYPKVVDFAHNNDLEIEVKDEA